MNNLQAIIHPARAKKVNAIIRIVQDQFKAAPETCAIVCAAIEYVEAICAKREISKQVADLEKFGIEDCDGFRDAAKKHATFAFARYNAAMSAGVRT